VIIRLNEQDWWKVSKDATDQFFLIQNLCKIMKSEIKRFVGKSQQLKGQILDKDQMKRLKGGEDVIGVQDIIDG